MTAQGWALTRFRRALASGSPALALAAAAEMGWVELADALALTLLLRDKERSRFERVALRWHARYCAEGSGVGLDEAMLVLFLLASLRAEDPEPPARVLQAHLAERHAVESSQAVTRWLVERQPPR